MKKGIILFQKNMIHGKVKTRLAKTVGNEKALAYYQQMVMHTYDVVYSMDVDVFVFFSDFIDTVPYNFKTHLQHGKDLGERMFNAFQYLQIKGYDQILILGTDCMDLETVHLKEAFAHLLITDYVIGPAKDGGYYLLGLKELNRDIFLNKTWSHNKVLEDTLQELEKMNASVHLLETLNDIDDYEDLLEYHSKQVVKNKNLELYN